MSNSAEMNLDECSECKISFETIFFTWNASLFGSGFKYVENPIHILEAHFL